VLVLLRYAAAACVRKVARLALTVAVCTTCSTARTKLTYHQNAARCVAELNPLDEVRRLLLSRFVWYSLMSKLQQKDCEGLSG
jgi:hypothetical protein